jgi:predicted dehydrogenase
VPDGSQLKVAIVGLEFGAEFIPIYQAHPDAELYAICQRSADHLDEVGDRFGVPVRYRRIDDLLADPTIDVVHINTPLQNHADHVVAALRAGKHVGCTIPMATSVEDCRRIVEAQQETGLTYMMMETVIYSREFLYVQDLYRTGSLGRLQFLRSSHQQDMTGWPSYWDGMPPMLNATHAISPVLALGNFQAESVQCIGSGAVFDRMKTAYGSPYSVESAHIRLKDTDVEAEVTRSLWAVARQYRESFDAYGSIRAFEWEQTQGDGHVLYLGEEPERIDIPDYASRLPEPIRRFTRAGVYTDEGDAAHRSFIQGGGHGGSHPHLVDALVSAVRGERRAYPDAVRAANITCAGILAHQSALRGGERIALPEWTIADGEAPLLIELDQNVEPPWAGSRPDRDESPGEGRPHDGVTA